MKASKISISLTTRDGKKMYFGDGIISYPFVIHRNIKSLRDMSFYDSEWCVTHIATGCTAFYVKSLTDAKLMMDVLNRFHVFKMPDCEKFYKLCGHLDGQIREALSNEGYSFATGRFRNA